MDMSDEQKELHRLEEELRTEILPGTEVMTDVGTHHFVKGSSQRVLVPQPSDSPHDPLNWSPFWKGCVITASTWVTFTQGYGPLSLAPMFPYYVQDFSSTFTDVVQFTGVAILVLGFSNFFWVPLASTFGRRPVMIASQVVNLGSAIWRARATTYGSFMGASVLNGFAAGPAETLQPAVIADIYFLHDRGKWNTLYWVFYMGSLMVGPIISGPMAATVDWRNFWWLYVAMIALSILMSIFMFPETQYHRAPSHRDASAYNDGKVSPSSPDEKAVIDTKENDKSHDLQPVPTGERDLYLGRGYPSKKQWGVYTPNPEPFKALLLNIWIPWKLFAFPIVEFASFVVSWSASCFLTVNLTESQVFAAPPYNFSPVNVGKSLLLAKPPNPASRLTTAWHAGFTNFAILVGALIGLLTAGPLSDWISMRSTIKNNGIREPEMRLPAMIPYVLFMILGNIVTACGYQYKWPWPAIIVLGYGCAGLQVAALPSIASTYAVDSYKPVAGSLFVSITVNKNVWGYGFSKFITPWSEQSGFLKPVFTNMTLTTVWCLFGILFFYKGKTFRRWTRNSSVHRM
ncbi:MAG: hypothetical protein M1828_000336 [Chrysothrix sp. TS-e1954]|nr:MAG: hypothetical protein M1828_000336 [Chrysothrix sp. TS-e1954]